MSAKSKRSGHCHHRRVCHLPAAAGSTPSAGSISAKGSLNAAALAHTAARHRLQAHACRTDGCGAQAATTVAIGDRGASTTTLMSACSSLGDARSARTSASRGLPFAIALRSSKGSTKPLLRRSAQSKSARSSGGPPRSRTPFASISKLTWRSSAAEYDGSTGRPAPASL